MKKLFLFVATMVTFVSAIASDQFYVIMKDGSVESYPTDKIDSISFANPQIAKGMGFNEMAQEIANLKKEIEDLKKNPGNGQNDLSTPVSGSKDGYEYVDLGLSVKWATMNLGATAANDKGTGYRFGQIIPDNEDIDIYQESGEYTELIHFEVDAFGSLTADYDAATQNWGKNWRMPTDYELQELVDKCTWTYTQLEGVFGYKINGRVMKDQLGAERDYSENWIFLPDSDYFSSTESPVVYLRAAYVLYLEDPTMIHVSDDYKNRLRQLCIRPVCK